MQDKDKAREQTKLPRDLNTDFTATFINKEDRINFILHLNVNIILLFSTKLGHDNVFIFKLQRRIQ
jgi:hypothetical protein